MAISQDDTAIMCDAHACPNTFSLPTVECTYAMYAQDTYCQHVLDAGWRFTINEETGDWWDYCPDHSEEAYLE